MMKLLKKLFRKRYGYLKHPLYYRKEDNINYDHSCKCEEEDRLTDLYPNICFRCMRLVKINSTVEERKCEHIHWQAAGSLGRTDYCFADPVCLGCNQRVAIFNNCRVLWKDLG